MKVGIVGPRHGADIDAAIQFCHDLHAKAPYAIVVSGGAKGIDQAAESTWHGLGGLIWSYRIGQRSYENFEIRKWIYGGNGPLLTFPLEDEPTFQDAKSALLYRSLLVAEVVDHLVAFHGSSLMRGTEFTTWATRHGEGKPVHVWQNGGWA